MDTNKNKKSSLRSAAKVAGIAIAGYYTFVGAVGALCYAFSASDIDTELANKLSAQFEVSAEKCYYVDPETKREITFLEPRGGKAKDILTMFTPFVERSGVVHTLGTMPVLKEAPCQVLNSESSLSGQQAWALANKLVADFTDPVGHGKFPEIKDRTGFVNIWTVSTPKP